MEVSMHANTKVITKVITLIQDCRYVELIDNSP